MEIKPQERYTLTLSGQHLLTLFRVLDGARFEGLDAARMLLSVAAALESARPEALASAAPERQGDQR